MFSTAFATPTGRRLYLVDNANPAIAKKWPALVQAARTGVTSASERIVGATAAGARAGYSTDWFVPLYPLGLNATGAV